MDEFPSKSTSPPPAIPRATDLVPRRRFCGDTTKKTSITYDHPTLYLPPCHFLVPLQEPIPRFLSPFLIFLDVVVVVYVNSLQS
jgi:hypothetical protein